MSSRIVIHSIFGHSPRSLLLSRLVTPALPALAHATFVLFFPSWRSSCCFRRISIFTRFVLRQNFRAMTNAKCTIRHNLFCRPLPPYADSTAVCGNTNEKALAFSERRKPDVHRQRNNLLSAFVPQYRWIHRFLKPECYAGIGYGKEAISTLAGSVQENKPRKITMCTTIN